MTTHLTTSALRSRRSATVRLFTALVAAGLASSVAQAQTAITLASGLSGKASAPTTNASTSGFTTGSLAAGSTTATFLDVSLGASNSTGVALGAGNSADSLTLSSGYVGTSADFSIKSLALTAGSFSGAAYAGNAVPTNAAGVRTITLGTGGMSNSAAAAAVTLDSSLTIDTGNTTQTWTAGAQTFNVYGNVKGTGTINIAGANLNLRNPGTSDFSGTWSVNTNATLAIRVVSPMVSGALGTGKVLLNNGGTLYANANGVIINNQIAIAAGLTGGNLQVIHGQTGTFGGPISNDSGVSTATLNIKANASLSGADIASIANITGDLSGHVGSVILGNTFTGFTANFASTSTLSFNLGANHFVDTVDTTSQALIRAGSGTDVTTAVFNGKFSIDLTAANTTAGNTWSLVDANHLNETYGGSFSVVSTALDTFANNSGVWTLMKDGNTWSFDQSLGVLSVSASSVPEPATYATLAGLGILGFAAYRRRKQS